MPIVVCKYLKVNLKTYKNILINEEYNYRFQTNSDNSKINIC